MADESSTPEAGSRCKVKTSDGEEIAVYTGFMWATEDGSRILDPEDVESWEEEPLGDGEFQVAGQTED